MANRNRRHRALEALPVILAVACTLIVLVGRAAEAGALVILALGGASVVVVLAASSTSARRTWRSLPGPVPQGDGRVVIAAPRARDVNQSETATEAA